MAANLTSMREQFKQKSRPSSQIVRALGSDDVLDCLPHYNGARVTLYYSLQGGVSDTGILSYMDNNWVEITKDSGERLLASIHAVRIIKLLEPGNYDTAGTLLRPATSPPNTEKQQDGD